MALGKQNKNWKITNVSRDLEEFKLLDAWNAALYKEAKLRKDFMKNVTCFKVWYLALQKAIELNSKVETIQYEYKKIEHKTDAQKDWLSEKDRLWDDIADIYENLPDIGNTIRKNEKKVRNFIKHPDLIKYKQQIEINYLIGKEHYLTETNSLIYNEIGGIRALVNIYRRLCGDYVYDKIYDKNGREFTGKWKDVYENEDPNVRKSAYIAKFSGDREHRDTLACMVYYIAKRMHQSAKLHNFKNEIEYKADGFYNISLANYMYIINQGEKYAGLNIKFLNYYHKLICEAYNLNKWEPWDDYLTLHDVYENVNIDQTQNLVVESLASLGKEYQNNIRDKYKKKIICWKNTGKEELNGYCISDVFTLDENPINIKWNGTTKGAITLSHELGHNLKNQYCKSNNEVNNETDKVLSEIPSIVNGFITTFYLIDKYRKEKNANYLFGAYYSLLDYYFYGTCSCGFACQYRVSICRAYLNNEKFNKNNIESMYLNDMGRYYGMSNADIKRAWNKSPYQHMRAGAYDAYINTESDPNANILGYYIGCIVGLPIAYKIYHGDKDMLNNYLKFLKAGNSIKPLNATKILGINLLKPQIYTESKQLMNKILNQFIKEIKVK